MTTPDKRNGTVALRKDPIDRNVHANPARSTRVLISGDVGPTVQFLESSVQAWGYETIVVPNDRELLHHMEREEVRPALVILDGAMQGVDSVALCRRIRLSRHTAGTYIILMTADGPDAEPFARPPSGPDDLLPRSCARGELETRVRTGLRVMDLETRVSELVTHLARAENKIRRLGGLLPICSHCKKIRDDSGYWNELEKYISDHSDAEFSHAICPTCLVKYYPDVTDGCL